MEHEMTTTQDRQGYSQKRKGLILLIVLLVIALICGIYYGYAYVNKTKIDLSKNMTVHYIGLSGLASVKYVDYHFIEDETNQYQKFLKTVRYHASKSSHLANGDQITITSDYDHEIAKQLNLRIVNTSRTFTVSGLPYRFQKGTEIDKSLIPELKSKALVKLTNAYPNNQEDTYNFTYNGTYFLKHKDFDSLVLIYKGDHKEKEDDGIEYSSKYYYYQVVGINSTFNKDVIDHGEFSVSVDELEYEGHDVTQETNIKEALPHLESYYASEVTKID